MFGQEKKGALNLTSLLENLVLGGFADIRWRCVSQQGETWRVSQGTRRLASAIGEGKDPGSKQ